MAKNKIDFVKKLEEIRSAAEHSGAEANAFYQTTLERYMMQIKIMEMLKSSIELQGTFVAKVDAKGNESMVLNPAISEYNKAASAANNTISTLSKILQDAAARNLTAADGDADEL